MNYYNLLRKYRTYVNIGLFIVQIVISCYSIYIFYLKDYLIPIEWKINIIVLMINAGSFFKSRNLFTLTLFITLLIGNFCGLTCWDSVTRATYSINGITLYWGQGFYFLLILIHLVFSLAFYNGILSARYWQEDFLNRKEDLNLKV